MRSRNHLLIVAAVVVAACGERATEVEPVGPAAEAPGGASIYWDTAQPTPEELEAARLDVSWQRVVRLDTIAEANGVENPERWEHITPLAVNAGPMHLPLAGDVAGPSVLRAQILLNRALFSPGIIDGRWGANTEKAVYWFQHREGLPATSRLDQATFDRLTEIAGGPAELIRAHRLTEREVAGPFVTIPRDIYAHAELHCSCYESLGEKLAERFHTSQEMLRRLNPGTELSTVVAGQILYVPNVRPEHTAIRERVREIVVSDQGRYVHALGSGGRILFHFPATLGSQYDPSPEGEYRVVSITRDPWWHYQPSILAHVDDHRPEARIPPGPNNAVGVVWMALNKPHYGVHGTNSPETIGYATSAGCVRLTNWDALFLAGRMQEGARVTFRDTG
jgi:lipoprotein-anchoring transpeptidase ErfK/SrfK